MIIFRSIGIFILAGLCEIGGCYLVWAWLKEGKSHWYGFLGGIILLLFGIVMTWQVSNFAKTCATYGGIYIVLSLIWAFKFDGYAPDKFDIIGTLICLIGASVIYYAPRAN